MPRGGQHICVPCGGKHIRDFFLAVPAVTEPNVCFSGIIGNSGRKLGVTYLPDIYVDAAIALLVCRNGK